MSPNYVEQYVCEGNLSSKATTVHAFVRRHSRPQICHMLPGPPSFEMFTGQDELERYHFLETVRLVQFP
jgi:hypothetical protein